MTSFFLERSSTRGYLEQLHAASPQAAWLLHSY